MVTRVETHGSYRLVPSGDARFDSKRLGMIAVAHSELIAGRASMRATGSCVTRTGVLAGAEAEIHLRRLVHWKMYLKNLTRPRTFVAGYGKTGQEVAYERFLSVISADTLPGESLIAHFQRKKSRNVARKPRLLDPLFTLRLLRAARVPGARSVHRDVNRRMRNMAALGCYHDPGTFPGEGEMGHSVSRLFFGAGRPRCATGNSYIPRRTASRSAESASKNTSETQVGWTPTYTKLDRRRTPSEG